MSPSALPTSVTLRAKYSATSISNELTGLMTGGLAPADERERVIAERLRALNQDIARIA